MKKLILISAFCFLLSGFAFGQITNGVKISTLNPANTLTGAEVVPMNQVQGSSNRTVTATVNQINAAPSAMASATSNTLAAAISAETTARLTAGTNANTYATGVSNSAQASITASYGSLTSSLNSEISNRQSGVSNALAAATNLFNAAQAALVATNAALAGQISAVAAGIGNSITNNGTVTLAGASIGNLYTPAVNLGSYTFDHSTTNLSLSAGSFQKWTLTPANSGNTVTIQPTNFVDGQNVWLYLNPVNTAYTVQTGTTVPGAAVRLFGSPSIGVGSQKAAVLNWQVFGTNIIFSAVPQP